MNPHSMILSKLIHFFSGLKCKECKYRCHRDCESHVPPSCGLPEDLLRHYINQLTKEGSPILPARLPVASNDPSFLASIRGPTGNSYFSFIKIKIWIYSSNDMVKDTNYWIIFVLGIPGVGYNPSMHIDSSSNTSSCNSSTPSSPAGMID